MFATRYNRPKTIPEKNSGIKVVETSGYLEKNRRIALLLQAGQTLLENRKRLYDYVMGQEPHDEDQPDPTRSSNWDLADASMYARELASRQKQKAVAYAAQKAANALVQQQKTEKTQETPPE